MELEGLTGRIKFDQFGLRTDFELEVVELTKKGLHSVNDWEKEKWIFKN